MLLRELPRKEQERILADLEAEIETIENPEERKRQRQGFKNLKKSGWIYKMYIDPNTLSPRISIEYAYDKTVH